MATAFDLSTWQQEVQHHASVEADAAREATLRLMVDHAVTFDEFITMIPPAHFDVLFTAVRDQRALTADEIHTLQSSLMHQMRLAFDMQKRHLARSQVLEGL